MVDWIPNDVWDAINERAIIDGLNEEEKGAPLMYFLSEPGPAQRLKRVLCNTVAEFIQAQTLYPRLPVIMTEDAAAGRPPRDPRWVQLYRAELSRLKNPLDV